MSLLTRLLRESARDTGRTAARELRTAVTQDPSRIHRHARVDPHWRRQEDGGAARLLPGELIDPGTRIGRWHGVDPRRPHDGWRSVWKAVGLVGWAGAVGGAWWLGHARSRGPLASVSELGRIGESLGASLDGFDGLEGVDGLE